MLYYPSTLDSIRTHLVSILRGAPDGEFVVWMGIKCSSWVSISQPSCGRSYLDPMDMRPITTLWPTPWWEGQYMIAFVNISIVVPKWSLFVPVWYLYIAFQPFPGVCFWRGWRWHGAIMIAEQPGSSLLARHCRFQSLCAATKARYK